MGLDYGFFIVYLRMCVNLQRVKYLSIIKAILYTGEDYLIATL